MSECCPENNFADNNCLLYCGDPCSLLMVWGLDGAPRPMGPGVVHPVYTPVVTTLVGASD